MDETVFQENFPDFPAAPNDVQRLGVLLRSAKLIEKSEWDELRTQYPVSSDLVKTVALRQVITPKILAEIESAILEVPFVDLERTVVANDVLKLISIDTMLEQRVLPIKLEGQELLVGCLTPADLDLPARLGANPSFAVRLGKVLWSDLDAKLKTLTEKKAPVKVVKKGPRKRLGDILIESKFVSEEALKEAIENSRTEKLRLGAFLVKKGLITNKQLSIVLSKQFDIPYVDLEEHLADPVLATLLPKKLCYDQILCPVRREEGKLVIAMTDPTDIITIDHIEMMTGMRISPVVSSELAIMSALGKLYGENIDSLADQVGTAPGETSAADDELGNLNENDAPIIKLVNLVLLQAAQQSVSDIHIEVYEKELRVRFRKDGILRSFMTPTRSAHAGMVSRIKVMANLDIAETRRPQDGRIKMSLSNRKVDLRVSCIPCVWGEKVVLRLLDQGNLKVNLTDLGFEPHVLDIFMEGVKAPNGIVLVTGPTGSGKTTTLYSSLFLLNDPGVNIMTAEDPVEYNLMGINQVQCHADIGLDFSAALRSFLRQDPDVIMLGEIRDFESASIAIKAAMTGHLVISTLHTNDAPATVARLLNMGIEPFSLSTSLRIVQAQRLVRRICKACSTDFKPSPDLVKSLGINRKILQRMHLEDSIDLDNLTFAKGAGCPECDHQGLRGRQGIYEVLPVTPGFRELIERSATTEEMRRYAVAEGMLSLRESAIYKVLTKRTSVEEVFRTTMDCEDESDDGDTGAPAAAHKPKPDTAAVPVTTTISREIRGPGFGELAAEIHEFRQALSHLSTGKSATNVDAALLQSNLVDPLAVLRGHLRSDTPANLQTVLPSVQAQGQKIDFNLKNLVSHFSDKPPVAAKVSLNQLVEHDIMSNLKHFVLTARLLAGQTTIGQGLKVTKNLSAQLPPILFDPDSFRLIGENLIVNALMALKPGGELKVVSRVNPGNNGRVELVIFDNGTGIAPADQDRLFQPFQPLGRKTMGLGLVVVKKLLDQLKCGITIKSTLGANTLVTLDFPVAG